MRSAAGPDPRRSTSRRRVLIVDDEPAVAALLQDAVGPSYRVEIASNGTDALAATRRMRPDVVLLDIKMPDLSGIEVLRRIRAMDASIPVIIVTATRDDQTMVESLRLGAFTYIRKPFSIKYIRLLVSAALADGTP